MTRISHQESRINGKSKKNQFVLSESRAREILAAKDKALELLELAPDVIKTNYLDEQRFYEQLALHAAKLAGRALMPQTVEPFKPLSEEEAKEFESEKFPYGTHTGETVLSVSTSYINKLMCSEFGIKLFRYSRSERFQRRHSVR